MAIEQKKSEYPQPMYIKAVVFWTGLIGGLFWGIMGFLASYFSFTEIRPNVILEPWALGYWKNQWQGTIVSIILYGILSIGVAFVYYFLLRKFSGFWVGLGYGLVIFLFIFLVLNPFFPSMKPFLELSRDTIITSVCLYILYGVFIGYSINYEYQNKIHEMNEPAS